MWWCEKQCAAGLIVAAHNYFCMSMNTYERNSKIKLEIYSTNMAYGSVLQLGFCGTERFREARQGFHQWPVKNKNKAKINNKVT